MSLTEESARARILSLLRENCGPDECTGIESNVRGNHNLTLLGNSILVINCSLHGGCAAIAREELRDLERTVARIMRVITPAANETGSDG